MKDTSFKTDFKHLIETVSSLNNNKPVVFVAHSMGNLILTLFLNEQSQGWKDKYIKHFYSISAPWAGTPKSLRDVISGDSIIGNNFYNREFDTFDRVRVLELVILTPSPTLTLTLGPSIWLPHLLDASPTLLGT
jgi:hypothetical protein